MKSLPRGGSQTLVRTNRRTVTISCSPSRRPLLQHGGGKKQDKQKHGSCLIPSNTAANTPSTPLCARFAAGMLRGALFCSEDAPLGETGLSRRVVAACR